MLCCAAACAATCAAAIVEKCSDYPILDADNVQIATLNVHCGLAFGKMAGVHVGNDYNRKEFIMLGESIDQVTKACTAASHDEVWASPEAYAILQSSRKVLKELFGTKKQSKKKEIKQPVLIASKKKCFFSKKKKRKFRLIVGLSNASVVPYAKMKTDSLKQLQKMLSLYVHPVILFDELSHESWVVVKNKYLATVRNTVQY